MLAALLTALQSVERDVAKPFEHCMQIGYALSAYGDWDRDGHADFLISAPTSIFDSTPTVALVSGADSQGLLVWRSDPKSTGWWFGGDLATHPDLDGDARPEIVASVEAATRVSVVLSSRDGKRLYDLPDPAPCLVDDLDGDACRDSIVRGKSSVPARETLLIASGKTGATLRVLVADRVEHVEAAALPNRGGRSELALLCVSQPGDAIPINAAAIAVATVDIVSLDDGKRRASRTIDFPASRPRGCMRVAGDVDGDGTADLVVSCFDNFAAARAAELGQSLGEVFVLSGRDLSTIRELTSDKKVARFGYALDAGADIDGNGVPDVLVTEYGEPLAEGTYFVVRLYSGRDGSLLREQARAAATFDPFGARTCFVGDADRDGTADYAISSVYIPDGTTTDPGFVELFSGKTGAVLRTWTR